MNEKFAVSSSPHTRSKMSTGSVMYDVILALMPVTFLGIYHYGLQAALVIVASIAAAVLTEYVFCLITKSKNTVKDGSAVLTGLLLALVLPSNAAIYLPILGSVFAILVVKCLFGGLGKNFMNPALAGRCFLLISFGTAMTQYAIDGVSTATPLALLSATYKIRILDIFLGNASGVIGSSILGILVGGIYLLIVGGITWEIPVSTLVSFTLFVGIFGGYGFNPLFLATHLCTGGIVLAAFFMATDPVSSPVTSTGQLLFGAVVGILSGIFRLFSSAADSVSYAVIFANCVVPMIDEFIIPKPFAFRAQKEAKKEKGKLPVPMSAIILAVITLVAGVCLSTVFNMTKDTIAEQKLKAQQASFAEVVPEAASFETIDTAQAQIDALAGEVYGSDFGKAYINEAYAGVDESGNVVGYVISAGSGDGFEGMITMAVGLNAEGAINGISFTELNETAGMGMRVAEPAFKDQFSGVSVEKFKLNKSGGSTADDEIDTVSGASTSSGAVVNAVNAALDFYANYMK